MTNDMAGLPERSRKTKLGVTAPDFAPEFIGQEYINIKNGSIYKGVGTDGPWNWAFIGRGATSPFTKDSIPGLAIWYDMTDTSYMTLDGNNGINILKNKAGDSNYDLTQATASYRPVYTTNRINGLATAVFNAAVYSHIERDTVDFAQPYTVFFVVKTTQTSWVIPVSFSAAYCNIGRVTSGVCGIYAGSNSGDIGTITSGAANLYMAGFSGVNSVGSINGGSEVLLSGGYTPGTASASSVGIGRQWASSYYLTGDIAEVLIYTRLLSAEERAYVKAYLNNRWAIY